MIVGFDVTAAIVGVTGVGHYTEMLWQQLLDCPDIEVRAFGAGRGKPLRHPARRVPVPLRLIHPLWRFAHFPSAERIVGRVDVLHSVDLVPPPTRAPLVITMHDAFCETHPHLVPRRALRTQRRQLAAARDAAMVVTTCRATADVLVELGFQRERLAVAPLGPRNVAAQGGPSMFDEPYVLAVGSVTPRKGFETLAAATALSGANCPLVVIAGPDGWRSEEVRQRVADADTFGRVRFVGERTDAELGRLYASATVVVHPSLAEGFGMVCLEAMAFGVPVVATDIAPTREITGDCARLVPVGDAHALANAMSDLLADEALRAFLGQCGLVRSRSFSWQRMAASVVDAYTAAIRLAA